MPPRKRSVTRNRTEFNIWHDEQLASGHDFLGLAWGLLPCLSPDARSFVTLADIPPDVLAEMDQCWAAHGDEITAEQIERFPCTRPWFAWVRFLLPADPRRQILADWPHDESLTPPSTTDAREAGGFESSFDYLQRNGMLTADEISRLAENEALRGRVCGQTIHADD